MTVTGNAPLEESSVRVKRGPNWAWVVMGAALFVVFALVITALRPSTLLPFEPDAAGLAQKPSPEQAPFEFSTQLVATIAQLLIGLVGVVLGVRMSLRNKSVLPIMVGLSGAFIVFPEVFYDVIGAVYMPYSYVEPLGDAFTILGRTMPVTIVAGWFGYGVFTVGTFAVLSARPSTRKLWYFWGAALAGDVIMEEVLLKFDVYHYYGNQPLVLISELPWWWIPCNSVGVMLAASIAHRFRNELRGAKALCMIVVTPMSVTAVYGFIALPSWIATNSDYPWLPTQLLGLATMILGVFAFMGVLKFVLNRDPFDLDYTPTEEHEFLRIN